MRNIYDNSEFFAAYAEMGRSKSITNIKIQNPIVNLLYYNFRFLFSFP